MNKYITYICDITSGYNSPLSIVANNRQDAEEKVMSQVCEEYNLDNPYNYREFITMADDYDIIVGPILDIEEI